jgi:hypothetical protein
MLGVQASRAQLREYSGLVPQAAGQSHAAGAVCDRCLQPIDAAVFEANVARLRAHAHSAQIAQQAAAQRAAATQVCPALSPVTSTQKASLQGPSPKMIGFCSMPPHHDPKQTNPSRQVRGDNCAV